MAPTSTPRVGSSKRTTWGSCTSDLAMTTFCWLPPESSTIFALALQRADLQPLHPIAGRACSASGAGGAGSASPPVAKLADIDVVVDHHGLEEAV